MGGGGKTTAGVVGVSEGVLIDEGLVIYVVHWKHTISISSNDESDKSVS